MKHKPLTCEICGAGPFKHPAPLGRHKRDHHGIAGTAPSSRNYRKKHGVKPPETPNTNTCDVCGQGPFQTPAALGSHKRIIHRIAGTSTNSNAFKAEQAASQTINRQAIDVVKHTGAMTEAELRELQRAKKLMCDVCGKGPFGAPQAVDRHKRNEHGIEGSSNAVIWRRRVKAAAAAAAGTENGHQPHANVTLSDAARLLRKGQAVSLSEAILALKAKRHALDEVITTLEEMER